MEQVYLILNLGYFSFNLQVTAENVTVRLVSMSHAAEQVY